MKLTVLCENTAKDPSLQAEHGLSLYIQTDTCRILFDMGQSSAFARNAQALGIDLEKVDLAVLSHGHYDHGGGLAHFLQCNQRAKVYVNSYAFDGHYHGPQRYIGLDPQLARDPRIVFTEEVHPLSPTLCIHRCNHRKCVVPIRSDGLTLLEHGVHLPEDYRHEQYLTIQEKGKTVLISGCSHRGIENIMHWFSPDVLIGGFHFMNITDNGVLENKANTLLKYSAKYYTGHCTGTQQFSVLKAAMADRLEPLYTGMTIDL